MRRLHIFLIALLMMISVSALQAQRAKLISFREIDNFPSASTVLSSSGRLYVTGDDSRHIFIFDEEFQVVDSVRIFSNREYRIPKNVKADIESSLFFEGDKIMLIGSGSAPLRRRRFVVDRSHQVSEIKSRKLFRYMNKGVSPLNIEGSCMVGSRVLLANRRTEGGDNTVFIADANRFRKGDVGRLSSFNILLPDSLQYTAISDITFDDKSTTLLMTLSTEETKDPVLDGPVGRSYVGWIRNFRVLANNDVSICGVYPLDLLDPAFGSRKVEGITVEQSSESRFVIVLVSDNDDGKSAIFRISLDTD